MPGRPLPKGSAKPDPPRTGPNVWNTIPGWFNKAADAVGVFKNEGEDRDERIDESHVYCYLMEEYMRFFVFKSFEEDLASSKVALTFLNNDFYTSVSSEYGILSSSMLEVLLECFLHITNLESPTEYAIPTDLIIEGITITLKALIRGMRSIRTLDYGPPAIAHSVRSKTGGFFKTTQEELFQELFQTSVCNRLFLFLTRAFGYAYWSATTLRLLRYIVEIWIMVLRPWGLSAPSWMPPTPTLSASQNNINAGNTNTTDNSNNLGSFVTGVTKSLGKQFNSIMRSSRNDVGGDDHHSEPRLPAAVEQARRDFVIRNLVLYGPTLVEFLHMAQRFNMTHKKELKIIILGFDGWNNPDVLDIVLEIDSCIKRTNEARRDSVAIPYNVESIADAARDSLKDVDASVQFHAIRGPFPSDIAQRLVSRMRVHLQSEIPVPVARLLQDGTNMCREIFGLSDKVSPVVFDLQDSNGGTGTPGSDRDGQPTRLSMRRTGRVGKVGDVKFLGNNKYRPIASYENPFFTRKAFSLSQLLKKHTGVELDLRLLGAYKVYVWLAVLSLFMLILIGFISLLQADFGPYEDYDYSSEYRYDSYDYERTMRQARGGGYR